MTLGQRSYCTAKQKVLGALYSQIDYKNIAETMASQLSITPAFMLCLIWEKSHNFGVVIIGVHFRHEPKE
jgi:hypothetical protein